MGVFAFCLHEDSDHCGWKSNPCPWAQQHEALAIEPPRQVEFEIATLVGNVEALQVGGVAQSNIHQFVVGSSSVFANV